MLAPPVWSRLRPRHALAGVTILGAIIVAGVLFRKIAHQNRRINLETYLIQRDFRGLAGAMAEPQQHAMLMHDSVSVDLLIGSLELLHRMQARHGQVGRYVVQVVAAVQPEKQPDRNPSIPTSVRHASLHAREFNFKEAIRAIQKLKRFDTKVTLWGLKSLFIQPKLEKKTERFSPTEMEIPRK
jgi:hypothetical protein